MRLKTLLLLGSAWVAYRAATRKAAGTDSPRLSGPRRFNHAAPGSPQPRPSSNPASSYGRGGLP